MSTNKTTPRKRWKEATELDQGEVKIDLKLEDREFILSFYVECEDRPTAVLEDEAKEVRF